MNDTINKIKKLKKGQSLVYHTGHLSSDIYKSDYVREIHSFIMDTIYLKTFGEGFRKSKIKHRKDCPYTTIQKKSLMGGMDYIIKRIK